MDVYLPHIQYIITGNIYIRNRNISSNTLKYTTIRSEAEHIHKMFMVCIIQSYIGLIDHINLL